MLRFSSDHKPCNDHNVYVLGAGFSFDAGLPLVRNFLQRMRDAIDWLSANKREAEITAVHDVLSFQQRAAAAAYRTTIDVENVEELFSLASSIGDDNLKKSMTTAIAATLDFCRTTTTEKTPRSIAIARGLAKLIPWDPAPDQSGIDTSNLVRFTRPRHDYYAAGMLGLLGQHRPMCRNTFITFNYDLVLEDSIASLGHHVSYGVPRKRLTPAHKLYKPGSPHVEILKLHGSINWVRPGGQGERLTACASYAAVRGMGKLPALIPPTWRKDFSRQFSDVWDAAIVALQQATRVIVIGFSMPETDVHFKYLISAGLQENVSLRKIIFADPTIQPVEDRALRVLRPELKDRGTLLFGKYTAEQLLLNRGGLQLLERPAHESVFWSA